MDAIGSLPGGHAAKTRAAATQAPNKSLAIRVAIATIAALAAISMIAIACCLPTCLFLLPVGCGIMTGVILFPLAPCFDKKAKVKIPEPYLIVKEGVDSEHAIVRELPPLPPPQPKPPPRGPRALSSVPLLSPRARSVRSSTSSVDFSS